MFKKRFLGGVLWFQNVVPMSNLVCSIGNEQGLLPLTHQVSQSPPIVLVLLYNDRQESLYRFPNFIGNCSSTFLHAGQSQRIQHHCLMTLMRPCSSQHLNHRHNHHQHHTIPLHILGKRDVSLKCQSQAGRSSIPGFPRWIKLRQASGHLGNFTKATWISLYFHYLLHIYYDHSLFV